MGADDAPLSVFLRAFGGVIDSEETLRLMAEGIIEWRARRSSRKVLAAYSGLYRPQQLHPAIARPMSLVAEN